MTAAVVTLPYRAPEILFGALVQKAGLPKCLQQSSRTNQHSHLTCCVCNVDRACCMCFSNKCWNATNETDITPSYIARRNIAPQGTNDKESFEPKTIPYTTAADFWSAGLMTNDMGTGFRLLGNPKCYRQLLFNIFDMLGMPTTDTWPGVELMPGYKMFCSSASWRAEFADCTLTADDRSRVLLDCTGPSSREALVIAVRGCLELNPAAPLSASNARDILMAPATLISTPAQLERQPVANAAGIGTQPLQPASTGLPASGLPACIPRSRFSPNSHD